ncbi:histone-lysine N-methyltransferase SETDB2 [Erythrolamprus reginae]|uniref:histone-lysine N-methyltransferase SETDB2 n=1 Tax=Erythrolamprus reginae TaxID=121349 RepID=UPI00396C4B13
MKVDAKRLWKHMEKNKVDNIFECMHEALLSLQQKIKDGTATSEECNQALALVIRLGMTDLLPLVHEDKHMCNLDLSLSAPGKITEDAGDDFSLLEVDEGIYLRAEGDSAETSSKFYQDHVCSKKCLSKRPWDSYKGENPLKLPMLCHFQRWHAKADSGSKSHDVLYKAPCGKSLRNFKDVQNYLFQTECSFLFLDHFSFNTYVQIFRSSSSPQAFVNDPDISQGAETVPVSFCNDIDHDRLPCFKYRKTSLPHGYFLNNFSSNFLDSCNCTDGCIDRTKCTCLRLTERAFVKASMSPRNGPSHGYTYKRLEEPISSGVYECSFLCSCDKNMCQNRLVQHGLQVRLQVFSTEKKGWGVRCLDDIDKGTFVCTYAGKLISRGEHHYQGKNSGKIEEVNKNTNQSLFSRKRKLDTVCSDSENELTQDTGSQQSLHLNAEGQPNRRIQNYTSCKNRNVQTITRPKTKTSLLQKYWRELGFTTASSDEDENSLCQMSGTRITSTTKKGDKQSSLQGEFEKLVNTINSEANTDCHNKILLSDAVMKSKLPMEDDKEVKKQHKVILESDCTIKGKTQKNKQELACMNEAAEIEACPMNEEKPCLLDATSEGNVGRFLNHSCSPNLFVQSVFVETHNRNYPWVAFFTNRRVKAGTELTWDYGYQAGSMPETETTCQCGSLLCRRKILLPGAPAASGKAPCRSGRRGGSVLSLPGARRPCRAETKEGREAALLRTLRPRPPDKRRSLPKRCSLASVLSAKEFASAVPAKNSPEVRGGPPNPGRMQDGDEEEPQPGLGPKAPNLAEDKEEGNDDGATRSSKHSGTHPPMFWAGRRCTETGLENSQGDNRGPPAAPNTPRSKQEEGAGMPAQKAAKKMTKARQQQRRPPKRASRKWAIATARPSQQKEQRLAAAGRKANKDGEDVEEPLPVWPHGDPQNVKPGGNDAATAALLPPGDSKMAEMTRRKCEFCPDDEPWAIMYISEEENLAVHQNCLLFSSGFMESEKQNPEDLDKRFDVTSVRKEIRRGRKLRCSYCEKRGATIGCEVGRCHKSYHYSCALRADASMDTDEEQGRYRLLCSTHKRSRADDEDYETEISPFIPKSSSTTNKMLCDGCQKKGATIDCKINTCDSSFHYGASMETDEEQRLLCSNQIPAKTSCLDDEDCENEMPLLLQESSSTTARMNYETVGEENMELISENHDPPKERIEFLKKCKQTGLLNEIFEKMLNTLHLAQEKLMDDNTSEAEYEETVTLLFDCGLFENIRRAALSGTERIIEELTNTRNRLDAEIERFRVLKEFSSSEDNTSSIMSA